MTMESTLERPSTGLLEPETPYYHLVPKAVDENLRWRREALAWGDSSETAQKELWVMCARDPLFWLNTFCWVYEPRGKRDKVLPYVTWEFQDKALLAMEARVGLRDATIEKSRDTTGTWSALGLTVHHFQFEEWFSAMLVSRNQDLVDKTDDPDCLFWKVLFLLRSQPAWLRPHVERNLLKLRNADNDATITGASTTGNVGRASRKTLVVIDEFAAFNTEDGYRALYATQAVTASRFFISTPQGVGNAFYDVAHSSTIDKIVLDWKDHPQKNPGLYATGEDGAVRIIDETYDFPDDYPFILDGKTRSPWYDAECERTPIPQLIAQELDRDYLGSDFQFFRRLIIEGHIKRNVRPAYVTGDIQFDKLTAHPTGFKENARGRLRLWCYLGIKEIPARDRTYVMGADISAGTGASNSCLSIADAKTYEKVAEFTTPALMPHEMAKVAAALGWWFCGPDEEPAYVVPEANGGHNRQFIKTLIDLGYWNLYFRRNEQKISPQQTDTPGWASTQDNKRELLEDYALALSEDRFLNRSREALEECQEYVYFTDGSIDHARARNQLDPSGAGANHGDRVIADALCYKGLKEKKRVVAEGKKDEAPPGSLAARMARDKQEHAQDNHWRRRFGPESLVEV